MNINEIVELKMSGETLTKEQISFVVSSYHVGKINDNKMYDFLKIIDDNNFNYEETFYLADAIARTGDVLDISKKLGEVVIDKHSAGAISDQSSLIFMSVLASLGVKNVKLLSSSFGEFTNSLDRFKVFDGFNSKITTVELFDILRKTNAGVIENNGDFTPVDSKLYEIRKKTGLVSVPLIAASILAKKIALGSNCVIYDVKVGEGALFNDNKKSVILAKYLVESSKLASISAGALVTNLDQPLGASLGARSEVEETLNILRSSRGLHGSRLLEVSRELVVLALIISGKAKGRSDAIEMFDNEIKSGRVLDKFREIINEYGAKYSDFKHSADALLNGVAVSYITSNCSGYVSDIKINKLIEAYKIILGNNDLKENKNIGLTVLVREGKKVDIGDKLIRVFYNLGSKNYFKAIDTLKDSIDILKNKQPSKKIFYEVVI